MAAEFLQLALGLVVVLVAGDLLVRGAVSVATAFKIPELFVSLTIVAFGTSAPELFVAARAAISDAPGLAFGAVIGSNIANLLLVLGLPALIFPISTQTRGLRLHAIAVMIATLVLAGLFYVVGAVGRPAGAGLLVGILFYVAFLWRRALSGMRDDPVIDEVEEYTDEKKLSVNTLLFILAGVVGLPIGAGLIVDHGVALAGSFGVRAEIVGLAIVAVGTSLPELATVLAAAFRRKSDVAIGTVLGSNIFNVFFVAGVAGLFGGGALDPAALTREVPMMLVATAAVALFIYLKCDIGRLAGAIMLAAYSAFLIFIAMSPGG